MAEIPKDQIHPFSNKIRYHSIVRKKNSKGLMMYLLGDHHKFNFLGMYSEKYAPSDIDHFNVKILMVKNICC